MKSSKIKNILITCSLVIMNILMYVPMFVSTCPISKKDRNGNVIYAGSKKIYNSVFNLIEYTALEILMVILHIMSLAYIIICLIDTRKKLKKKKIYLGIVFSISIILFIICIVVGANIEIQYM